MSKLVYVDADGKEVAEGSAEAAFQFHQGDDRLDKFRAAAKAKKALASGKPVPAAAEAEESTTERVAKK